MGACMIACGKDHVGECHREQAYLSSEQIAEIEEEVKAKPLEPPPPQLKLEEDTVREASTQPTCESLRNTTRTSQKSRFFHQRKQGESVLSLFEETETIQQPLPRLQLRLSRRKTSKRPRKPQFREQDWQDETSSERRSTCQNVFQNFAKQHPSQSFISVRMKKPLLLSQPIEAVVSETNEKQSMDSEPIGNVLKSEAVGKKIIYADGSTYSGEMVNYKRHGRGKLEWKDGSRYEGEWREDKAEGRGVLAYADGDQYSGVFRNNQAEGRGEFFSAEGLTYDGEWRESLPEGQGCEVFHSSERYAGSWSRGKKNGVGELYFEDGTSFYKGEFANNELHGQGEYYWHGKSRYVGGWEHNERSGRGRMEWENGQRYEGQFQHDKMHGQGVFLAKNGSTFKGVWECGRREGVMVETDSSGEVKQGVWYFNKLLRYVTAGDPAEQDREVPRGRLPCRV